MSGKAHSGVRMCLAVAPGWETSGPDAQRTERSLQWVATGDGEHKDTNRKWTGRPGWGGKRKVQGSTRRPAGRAHRSDWSVPPPKRRGGTYSRDQAGLQEALNARAAGHVLTSRLSQAPLPRSVLTLRLRPLHPPP